MFGLQPEVSGSGPPKTMMLKLRLLRQILSLPEASFPGTNVPAFPPAAAVGAKIQ